MREMPEPGPEHKLLFFGPDEEGTMKARDMETKGVLPESQMDDRLNQMSSEGWRVVHRSFEPSYVMKQWRIMLVKP